MSVIQDEIIKEIIGRRKKVFRSSLKDLKRGNIALPHKDKEFTGGAILGTIRRADDAEQAIEEYARIFRPKAPVAIRVWLGPHFLEKDFIAELSKYFTVHWGQELGKQRKRTLAIFKCTKK